LETPQVKEGSARFEVDEKVDIALLVRFAACDGPKTRTFRAPYFAQMCSISSRLAFRSVSGVIPARDKSTRWLQAIAGVGLTGAALWHAAVVWTSPPTETPTRAEG
jgi:hypothetical protein